MITDEQLKQVEVWQQKMTALVQEAATSGIPECAVVSTLECLKIGYVTAMATRNLVKQTASSAFDNLFSKAE